jgi:hypothetical protein
MKTPSISTDALEGLEREVKRALETGDDTQLSVLGYGEISVVVALELGTERYACKRLPPMASRVAFEAFRALFDEYIERLEEAGTKVVPTELVGLEVPTGVVAYFVQPRVEADLLLPRWLGAASSDDALALFAQLLDRIEAVISTEVGLDAQLSNWVLQGGEPVCLDVGTPMLRTAAGADRLDLEMHLASLPWALRGAVRRFMAKEIFDTYFDARTAVLDLLGNMHKERLERLLPAFLDLANKRFEPALSAEEVQRYYRSDALMWEALLRLRRVDRWWQRSVRGRSYPFLLPGDVAR